MGPYQKQIMITELNSVQWTPYRPGKKAGKLCYYICAKSSYLPVRDALGECHDTCKSEPNYETETYNFCAPCNQDHLPSTVRDGLSHLLFVTRYKGTKCAYVNRYFIVGYYELGWTAKIHGRTAVRAKSLCFVPIEHAYEITDERWQRINVYGETQSLKNLRRARQCVNAHLLHEIVRHLDGNNCVAEYVSEIARITS